MKKWLAVPVLFVILSFTTYAQQKYDISSISPEMIKEANVVKRLEEVNFEIKKLDETILKHKYAITILNEKGENQAILSMSYDKLHTIKSIEGTLFDAKGNLIRKMKSKEVMDLSGVDDNNLIDDNRRKFFSFYHKVYPYTVEFETEEEFKNTLFFPGWIPQEDEFYAVEYSKFTVICSDDYEFRFKAFNYSNAPVVVNQNSKKITSWEIRNLKPFRYEYGLPDRFDMTTVVLIAPTAFKIQNYTGNMSNWNEFGKFVYALKQDKDELPAPTKLKVHQLIDELKTNKEKVQLLYQFMQQNTRYISIQLGIGGWQPFDAKYVASKGYGDCKALTNYMFSLLKEAGIKSYYTLIKAGRNTNDINNDFTSQQFNHVILCVPLAKDTVWLECTSQTMPSGYLGDFTSDRYALLIDESGGKLIRTPKYGLKENLQVRRTNATVHIDGTMQTKIETMYTGMQQDNLHGMINNISKDKIKEYLNNELEFSTYDVSKFLYKEKRSELPTIDEDLDLIVTNYASITGKRLFLVPNIMTKSHQKLSKEHSRKNPIKINYEYQDIDTVIITVPEGYEPESLPPAVNLNTKFGKFTSHVKFEKNRIIYYRDYQHYSGVYDSSEYLPLAGFYENIYKADRAKVVLVKKSD
jgi:hypothetical protein